MFGSQMLMQSFVVLSRHTPHVLLSCIFNGRDWWWYHGPVIGGDNTIQWYIFLRRLVMIGEENKYLDDKYQAIQTKRSIDSDGIW